MNPNNNNKNDTPPSPPHTPPFTKSPQQQQHPLQSLAVITIAGFGGAIAGLSISRRGMIPPTMHHVQLSNQLPWLWALGCATFAGVIEFSTLISPTRLMLSTLREYDFIPKLDSAITTTTSDNSISSPSSSLSSSLQERILHWDDNSTAILGDYVLGGAFAGAMFKGSQIRPNTTTTTNNTNTTTSPSSSSSSLSTTTNNTNISEGSIKQKRAIGRGKVITLATKNQYKQQYPKKSKLIPTTTNTTTTTQRVIKQGTETLLKHGSTNKASLISGLGPGIALGLFAGLLQIGIGRLNMIMEEYNDESNEQQQQDVVGFENEHIMKQNEKENHASNQKIDDLTRQVKGMTTDEILQEIERLKK